MALKLGKCRLCLKLGDFYSIFTVDSALQLAQMAMACAQIKVLEGDGLPDKVCGECVEKLSSAFIFKQQCERSDQELRRNYAPPPGFSNTPPPNRQSSDSGYSNRTDISYQKKLPNAPAEKPLASTSSAKKRSRDNLEINNSKDLLEESLSVNVDNVGPHPYKTRNEGKRARTGRGDRDSDFEYSSFGNMSADSDSNEPLLKDDNRCDLCDKQFVSKKSLSQHKRVHARPNKSVALNHSLGQDALVNIPQPEPVESPSEDERLACSTCNKTFKLKIMLNRHTEFCQKVPKVEIEQQVPSDKVIDCELCSTKFKTVANLEKHMRVVHGAVLKSTSREDDTESFIDQNRKSVPCLFCRRPFYDYLVHKAHFTICSERHNNFPYICICKNNYGSKSAYFKHLKDKHFEPPDEDLVSDNVSKASNELIDNQPLECRICKKMLPSQEMLVNHLAGHMSNMNDDAAEITAEEDSRAGTLDDSASQNSEESSRTAGSHQKCQHCDKVFTYRKSLLTHMQAKHSKIKMEIKTEAEELPFMNESEIESDNCEESNQEDSDNTCDICEKIFSYKHALIHHKKTKHNMSSGHKRAKVVLKKCQMQCLICDITTQVSESNKHNQIHLSANIKPKNVYTCSGCGQSFKSCQNLANHIRLVHRLKQTPPVDAKIEVTDVANFCEVVVTKTEPLDYIQGHGDIDTVPPEAINGMKPIVDLSGFTCPICNKKMGTLISLKRHVNWHANVGNNLEKKHECMICKLTFRFTSHFKLHMKDHYHDTNLDPKFLTCSICTRKSKHLRAAQAHMNWHKQTRFNTKDYQCSICKRVFQYRKVYLSHMAVHYKKGDSIEKTVIGLSEDMKSSNFPESHQCPHCQKVLDSANSLKCHMSWHKSKTSLYGFRYECEICKTQFTNKRRHELHVRTHFEDENGPYKCPLCTKAYNDEDHYRRHVKSHNFDNQVYQDKKKIKLEKLREKKIKCPICCRLYPDLVKLIRHLRRSHPESKMIKEDPDAPPQQVYSCKLCAKIFSNERRLQKHEEAHLRKPEFFKCKFCGKKTISLKNHNLHIKSHLVTKHRDNPLKCPNCEERFVLGYDLHYHMRDVHDITETWIAERGVEPLSGPLKELQCSVCHKILASKGNYERHIDYHNSLRCNYCFDYFSGKVFLEGHLAFACEKKKLIGETEVYPKKIKCHICYKAYHIQIKLDCHLRTKHNVTITEKAYEGKKELVCDYCFQVYENEDALNSHKLYHRTIGYYGCIYCSRKFNTLTTYRKHKNHHYVSLNVENPTKCEHCDERFVAFRDMIYHMRDVHGDDKEWIVMPKASTEEKCHICDKVFFNLHRHLAYHEQNRCKKCAEYFYSSIDFDNHLCAIESDEEGEPKHDLRPKYEECRFCFKPVTKSNSRLKHDLIHRGSGSISCRFCPFKFKTIDAFNIHAFSHRSRKYKNNPLKCRFCGEKFVTYGLFVRHLRGVHKSVEKMHYRATVRPQPCAVCHEEFPNLHCHYRAHIANQCGACRLYFTSSKLFSEHQCGVPDSDPSKVFTCTENLFALINSYVPQDEYFEAKYYDNGNGKDEEDENPLGENDSQTSQEDDLGPMSVRSPIIAEVLSLQQELELGPCNSMGNGSAACDDDDDDVQLIEDDDDCNDITIIE